MSLFFLTLGLIVILCILVPGLSLVFFSLSAMSSLGICLGLIVLLLITRCPVLLWPMGIRPYSKVNKSGPFSSIKAAVKTSFFYGPSYWSGPVLFASLRGGVFQVLPLSPSPSPCKEYPSSAVLIIATLLASLMAIVFLPLFLMEKFLVKTPLYELFRWLVLGILGPLSLFLQGSVWDHDRTHLSLGRVQSSRGPLFDVLILSILSPTAFRVTDE